MPLVPYSLEILRNTLRLVDADPERIGHVLTLAHPDVVASRGTLAGLFGTKVNKLLPRKDSEQIINWHKAHKITDQIVDTRELFELLGYQMRSIDIVEGRGGEAIHDLSYPLPPDHPLRSGFDLVFDCITNQCFTVAQAWWNMVSCCRVGGWMLSVTPVQCINQGFWNVSPNAYTDFFPVNGCEVVSHQLIEGIYERQREIPLSPIIRMRNVPDDTMNVVLIRKKKAWNKPTWPIMTKFKTYPTCLLPTPVPK